MLFRCHENRRCHVFHKLRSKIKLCWKITILTLHAKFVNFARKYTYSTPQNTFHEDCIPQIFPYKNIWKIGFVLQVAKFNSQQILNRSSHGSITVKFVSGAYNYLIDEVLSNLEMVLCWAPVDLSWNDPAPIPDPFPRDDASRLLL